MLADSAKQFFWGQEVSEVAANLGSDIERGLSEEEAKKRVVAFGSNRFRSGKGPSVFSIFFRQFQSPLIIILVIAAMVTVVIGEWDDASIIIFAVVVNTFLGFYQENKAERAIADLRSYIQERARVIRGSVELDVDASTI